MRKDDAIRLRHMLDAAYQAIRFSENRNQADLETDPMLMLALIKLIETIGEAASKVTTQSRSCIPEIPWDDIIRMRHRLVHAYFDINQDILWQTIQDDLPTLIPLIERALKNLVGDGHA